MNNFEYQKALEIKQAIVELDKTPDAKYIAGGTNLIDLWKYNLTHPTALVDVSRLGDENVVERLDDGGIRISAFATNAETAYHPIIEQGYPLLSRAILAGASAQIRNMATNGGNLLQRTRCYYFYDPDVPCNKRNPGSGCPAIHGYNRMHAILGGSDSCIAVFPSDMSIALAALDAVINVSGTRGDRQIPFAEFHRLPGKEPQKDNTLEDGELITSIDLPKKGFSKNHTYLKLRDRHSYAFALVSVAIAFELSDDLILDARIALGGVAHKPWRVASAELFLEGKKPISENFGEAAEMILQGAQGFGYNDFKIDLAKKAIIRAGMMALQPHLQIPGAGPSV